MPESRHFDSLLRHCYRIQKALASSKLLDDPVVASETAFMDSAMYRYGVARDLTEVLRRVSKGRVLDIGCGTGFISAMMALSGLSVTGVEIESDVSNIHNEASADWSHRSYAGGQVRDFLAQHFPVNFLQYGGLSLPWGSSEFDAIIGYAVVEHIDEDMLDQSLDEMVRVLKPGGLLFIFRCPRTWGLTERLSKSHERLISEGELKAMMVNRGLEILKFGRNDFFPQFAPSIMQPFWNLISPILIPVQKVLDHAATNLFSHNMWLVSKKTI